MIVGELGPGTATQTAAVDTRYYSSFGAQGMDTWLVKVTAYLDGLGAGSGNQVAQAVVYGGTASGSELLVSSQEVEIADGQAVGWVDFYLDQAVLLPSGIAPTIGLHFGGNTQTTRFYRSTTDNGLSIADTYAGGAAATLGSGSSSAGSYSIFATLFSEWTRPDLEDADYGRWPFIEAQLALSGAATTSYIATCGWHGTVVDREVGSFAVVNQDGPLVDLVGERLRITYLGNTVVAYCHAQAAILEDISLTRRLFLELGVLSLDQLDAAEVEVVA